MDVIIETILERILQIFIGYMDVGEYWTILFFISSICLIFFLTGSFITWTLTKRKIQSEINNLNVETKNNHVLFIEKIQKYREEYLEESKMVQLSISNTISSIKDRDLAELETSHNELCEMFFNDFLPVFLLYLVVYEVEVKSDTMKRNNFVYNEIMRLFKTVSSFLEVINYDFFLRELGKPKVIVSKESVIGLINFIDNTFSSWNIKRRVLINRELKKVGVIKSKGLIKRNYK